MTGVATQVRSDLRLDIAPLLGAGPYTHIQVFRSRVSATGPFTEITSSMGGPARVEGIARPAVLDGTTLDLRIQESISFSVTFAGANPIAPADAATQITFGNEPFLRCFVENDALVLESTLVGTTATLRVVGGDAAALLGFPLVEPDSVGIGTAPCPPILSSQTVYRFTDSQSDPGYWYKFRLTDGASFSAYSDVFTPADVKLVVAESEVVTGTVRLMTMTGQPLRNAEVRIRMVGFAYNSGYVTGVSTLVVTTDSLGYASAPLLRGATYAVIVSGMSAARQFTAPSDLTVSSFDMFDPAYGSDDLFSVQRPNVPYAVKRSL